MRISDAALLQLLASNWRVLDEPSQRRLCRCHKCSRPSCLKFEHFKFSTVCQHLIYIIYKPVLPSVDDACGPIPQVRLSPLGGEKGCETNKQKKEEGMGVPSDVFKAEGEDPDTPGYLRGDRVRLGRRRSRIVGASPLQAFWQKSGNDRAFFFGWVR